MKKFLKKKPVLLIIFVFCLLLFIGSLSLGITNVGKLKTYKVSSKVVTAIENVICSGGEDEGSCNVKSMDEHGKTYFVHVFNSYDVVKDETFTAYTNSITNEWYLHQETAERSGYATIITNFSLAIFFLIMLIIIFRKIIKKDKND